MSASFAKYASHAAFCGWHVDQRDSDCTCAPAVPLATDDGHDYANGDGERVGNWMQTFTGRQFWPLDPRADEVCIEDIAHALSMACRYGGHCERFYSVAEHSVLVSRVVPAHLALDGLLHDAAEAYVADVIRPIKPFLAGYKAIEGRVWAAIADHFGLRYVMPREIKDADNAVLLAESVQIMKPHPAPWSVPGEPADVVIVGHAPGAAKELFLSRFYELTSAKAAA